MADPAARCGARLLVVDDNKVNRLLLARSPGPGRAIARRSPRTAASRFEMLKREPFDMLLLDMEIPEMDGFQVLSGGSGRPTSAARPPVIVTSSVEGSPTSCAASSSRRGLPGQTGEPGAAQGAHRREPWEKRLRDQQKELVRRFATSRWRRTRPAESGFSLGGRRVHGSVMFSDIRGFTRARRGAARGTIELSTPTR